MSRRIWKVIRSGGRESTEKSAREEIEGEILGWIPTPARNQDDGDIEGACEEVGSCGKWLGEEGKRCRWVGKVREDRFRSGAESGSKQFIESLKRVEPLDLNSFVL